MQTQIPHDVEAFMTAHEYAKAYAALRDYLFAHPEDCDGWARLVGLAVEADACDRCADELRAASRQFSDKADVWIALGDVLSIQQEFEAALSAYQCALDLTPAADARQRSDLLVNLATTHECLDNDAMARKAYQQAVAADPQSEFARDEYMRFLSGGLGDDGQADTLSDDLGDADDIPLRDDDPALFMQICNEHPDYLEALERNEHMTAADGTEFSPRMHVSVHQIIRTQVRNDDPQGVRALFHEFVGIMGNTHTAEHEMGTVICEHLRGVVTATKPFDPARYLCDLRDRLAALKR